GGGSAHHRPLEPDGAGRRSADRGPAVVPGPAGGVAAGRLGRLLPDLPRRLRDVLPAVGGAGLVQPVPGARADPAGRPVPHRAGVAVAGDRAGGPGRRRGGGAVRAARRVAVPPSRPTRGPRGAGAAPGPPAGL
ncbi:MAG: hypothetical protein AVDCRST_MAG48-3194, partial [uncultured Friedmanniella sp.]